MDVPIVPPVKPMLAKATADVPEGACLYEQKWDGFRCIGFGDGDGDEDGSRNERAARTTGGACLLLLIMGVQRLGRA